MNLERWQVLITNSHSSEANSSTYGRECVSLSAAEYGIKASLLCGWIICVVCFTVSIILQTYYMRYKQYIALGLISRDCS